MTAAVDDSSQNLFSTSALIQTCKIKRTFRPGPKVAVHNAGDAKEDRDGADAQAKRAPEPLDDAVFGDAVPEAQAKDVVDVLDQSKVGALDDVLFGFAARVESDC